MTVPFPHISPVLIALGPLELRWYGLMYAAGYTLGYFLARRRSDAGRSPLTLNGLDSLIGYLVIGMLIGARLTYVLVYDRTEYGAHPLEVFAIWRGGLSFHGAIVGMAVGCALFAHRRNMPLLAVTDLVAVCGAPGLFFGRLGNFVNAELYGRPTTLPWAMIFPTDPAAVPRHPSQLYEALGEGVLLGSLLWLIDSIARRHGVYRPGLDTALFLIGYGIIRFLIEFTRQPDAQLGFVFGPLSMGQLLSAMMMVVGTVLLAVVRSSSPSRLTA
ncbi:MAG: prolipoprotein diacylglyceryl transferase [Gemmatimonadaceae bacterium]